MIRRIVLSFVVALVAGVVAPTALAEQLQANVVSWAPNDVRPGEPVSVVLELYLPGPSPYPQDGQPVAGVNDVGVVITGEGQTRRFATEDLGGGHYHTEIVFPKNGGWDLRVRYGSGDYGAGDEILLGKGAICVGGDVCVGERPAQSASPQTDGRAWRATPIVAGGLLVALVVGASMWLGAFGPRPRFPRAR